jgi:Zn-dependent protease with chaperone function
MPIPFLGRRGTMDKKQSDQKPEPTIWDIPDAVWPIIQEILYEQSPAYREVCFLSNVGAFPQASSFITAGAEINSIYYEVLSIAGRAGPIDQVPILIGTHQVPNAAAFIYAGQRIIAYNPVFFHALRWKAHEVELTRTGQPAGERWATLFLLAHELGHHVRGHVATYARDSAYRHNAEYEADDYAVGILKQMGANERDITIFYIAMMYIIGVSPELPSPTHPSTANRIEQIVRRHFFRRTFP